MNETLLEKYVRLIEYYKLNKIIINIRSHPEYQAHHVVPECFQKIKFEHKHDITKYLEKLYDVNETVVVPNRVHFELHILLAKMYPERSQEWFKMSFALQWFQGKRNERCDITSEEYEQTRLINSVARSCVKVSDETRKNVSLALHRPEVIAKRKATFERPEIIAKISGANNWHAKSVVQYTNDGVFIERFGSIKEASDKTNTLGDKISQVCRGLRLSTNNFVWRFGSEYLSNENLNILPAHERKRLQHKKQGISLSLTIKNRKQNKT